MGSHTYSYPQAITVETSHQSPFKENFCLLLSGNSVSWYQLLNQVLTTCKNFVHSLEPESYVSMYNVSKYISNDPDKGLLNLQRIVFKWTSLFNITQF